MSGKRWDLVVSSKDRNDKNRYTKVGAIFLKDNGSLSIALDKGIALVGGMEGVYLNGYEPKERGESAPRGQGPAPGAGYAASGADDDSEIPF